jgi:predicted CXXCH cytochrome family protein
MRFLRLVPAMICVGLVACGGESETGTPTVGQTDSGRYVGAGTCTECHAEQSRQWAGSHHDLAMQVATSESVVANFSDTEFVHHDVVTTFSQRDDRFFVRTDGDGGELAEFPIVYTFGVYPLQQYLVEMADGRLQALSVAWDSRPAQEGGQRWFHVYGDERIDHADVLHWTRPSQNWDTMCADCHSTGLAKRYDLDTGQFDTSWEAINVSCEACHGPGNRHVAWAKSPDNSTDNGLGVILDERRGVNWVFNESTGNSRRSEPRRTAIEIDTCAPCHSRRSRIAAAPTPGDEYLQAYLPALLEAPLYFGDGQIRDEVYVYGSFLQSRMYREGVTCSDCHEPHSLQLRAPGPGVCLQCHLADKYATTEHHLHAPESVGANCIECHMPPTTYMQVDPRHDHSFRIPRPGLSLDFETPNACTQCHADKDAQWALQVLRQNDRLPGGAVAHWSRLLAQAGSSPSRSRDQLLGLATEASVPNIVRASAINRLYLADDSLATALIGERAESSDPLIRWAVARALGTADAATRVKYGPDLLNDPVRAVRIAAASALAPLGLEVLPPTAYPKLEQALDEFIEAQLVTAERAESHVNIGNLQRELNRLGKSEQSYLTAIRLSPYFVPAYVNLADLYRVQEREADVDALLRGALADLPAQPALHHSLGLSLIRQGRMAEATRELGLAAKSDDSDPRFALAYALALDAQGNSEEAISFLQNMLEKSGDDPALIAALANIYQRAGNDEAARELVERMRGP